MWLEGSSLSNRLQLAGATCADALPPPPPPPRAQGVASYYHAVIDGKEVKDAAWYYPSVTTEKAKPIENWVAFYKSKVQVK